MSDGHVERAWGRMGGWGGVDWARRASMGAGERDRVSSLLLFAIVMFELMRLRLNLDNTFC